MHSPIAVAPFASRQLLIGEVIRKRAFENQVVQDIRNDLGEHLKQYPLTRSQIAALESAFGLGFFLWPLSLTVGDLDRFFRPDVFEDKNWKPLPSNIETAFDHVATSFAAMMKALQSEKIGVIDMNNNPVHSSLWRRPGITIDLVTSDLYEISMEQWHRENPDNGRLRYGVRLSSPDERRSEGIGLSAKSDSVRGSRKKVAAPKMHASGDGRQKRPGPKERYDGERLREETEVWLKSRGPFHSEEQYKRWCLEPGRIRLKAGALPPKNKKRGDAPDAHTLDALLKRHKILDIPGLIAKR